MRPLSILLTLAVLLIGVQRASAIINLTTDTATMLIGNFALSGGFSFDQTPPSVFQELPGNGNALVAQREYLSDEVDLIFYSADRGTPDDPYFLRLFVDSATSFDGLSGTYTNGPNGYSVDFRFFDFEESSGLEDGTFSGNFEFKVRTASVPDGGFTLGLLGAVLVGLTFMRRRIA